jgi:hypothetical protein
MPWNPNRSSKEHARKLALDFQPGKKVLLFMPGLECADLKLGHKLGLFHPQAQFTLVEQDPKTARKIADYCGEDPRYNLFVRKLESLYQELPELIDFAYIDLCGAITRNFAKWLPCFFGKLATNADVAFTMCLQKRGNVSYLNELLEQFKTTKPEDYKFAYEHYVLNENLPHWTANVICSQLWPIMNAASESGVEVKKCLFHTYQDTNGSGWMCLYRFSFHKDTTMSKKNSP